MIFDNLLQLCTSVDVSLILLTFHEVAGAFLLDCIIETFIVWHLDFDIKLIKMKLHLHSKLLGFWTLSVVQKF
jgi:hypothetical protein